jgi:hypothetical protein
MQKKIEKEIGKGRLECLQEGEKNSWERNMGQRREGDKVTNIYNIHSVEISTGITSVKCENNGIFKAIAQAISRRLPTAATRVQSQVM